MFQAQIISQGSRNLFPSHDAAASKTPFFCAAHCGQSSSRDKPARHFLSPCNERLHHYSQLLTSKQCCHFGPCLLYNMRLNSSSHVESHHLGVEHQGPGHNDMPDHLRLRLILRAAAEAAAAASRKFRLGTQKCPKITSGRAYSAEQQRQRRAARPRQRGRPVPA